MTRAVVEVGLEVGPKRKVFAQVVGWPGWARGARDEARALAAIVDCAPRYAAVAGQAGLVAPAVANVDALRVTERVDGGPTTDVGALERPLASDALDHAWELQDRAGRT